MSVGYVFGILGGVGGIASACAAAWAAKIASGAYKPFVQGAATGTTSTSQQVDITLRNSGPGAAIGVRCRIGDGARSDPIASMASGQTTARGLPKPENFGVALTDVRELERGSIALERLTVEVAFSGLDGTRWRVIQRGVAAPPQLQRLSPRWLFVWREEA
jgi:hypothetical protein